MISLHDLGHHLPCLPWDLQAPFQYILGPQKPNLPAFPGTLCAPTPLQVTDNTSCLNYSQLGKVSPGSICVCFQEYELVFSGRRKVLDISTFPRKEPGNMFVTSKGVSLESLGHKPGSLFGKYFWKVFPPSLPFCPPPWNHQVDPSQGTGWVAFSSSSTTSALRLWRAQPRKESGKGRSQWH